MILAMLFFSSCVPAYFPSAVNVPGVREKNDSELNLLAGYSGLDVQGNYALSDHLVVSANINTRLFGYLDVVQAMDEGIQRLFEHRRILLEGGGGYYRNIGEYGQFSLIGGAGASYYKRWEIAIGEGRSDIDGKYFKYYFQPSIGLHHDYGNLVGSLRVVHLRINEQGELITGELLEPMLTLGYGIPYVHFNTQAGFSILLNEEQEIGAQVFPFYVSAGASLKFFQREKRGEFHKVF